MINQISYLPMLDRALNPTFAADSYYFSMRLIAMRGPQADPFTFKISIQKGLQKSDYTKAIYNMEGTECSLNDEFLNFNVPVYNPNRPIDFTANMTDETLAVYTSFPITPGKLITEFINSGKNTFQEVTPFEDPTYELEYVIYVEKSRAALLNLIRTTTELQITSPLNSPLKGPESPEKTPNKRTVTPKQRQPTPKAAEPRVQKKVEPEPAPEPVPEPPADTKGQSMKKSLTPTKIQRRNQSTQNQEAAKVQIPKTDSYIVGQQASSSNSKLSSRQGSTSGATLSSSKQKAKEPEPAPAVLELEAKAEPEVTQEPKPELPQAKSVEKKLERSAQKIRKAEQPQSQVKVQTKIQQKPKVTAPAVEKKVEKKVEDSALKTQLAPVETKPIEPLAKKKIEQNLKKVEKPTEKSAGKIEKSAAPEKQEPKGNSKLIIIAVIVAAILFGLFFMGGSKGAKQVKGKKSAKKIRK